MSQYFGWFGLSRTAGYILGPLLGGFLLTCLEPAFVMASTSLIAMLAFVPVTGLRQAIAKPVCAGSSFLQSLTRLPDTVLHNRPLLAFGLVEMCSRIGVYAVKTFLPLMILAQGGSPLQAGLFLSVQEFATAVMRPLAGRMADRFSVPEPIAVLGLVLTATSIATIPLAADADMLLSIAVLIGIGNGTYQPAMLFMIGRSAGNGTKGAVFGIAGAMRNLGKLTGPFAGGLLLYTLSAENAFLALALTSLAAALPLAHKLIVEPKSPLQTPESLLHNSDEV